MKRIAELLLGLTLSATIGAEVHELTFSSGEASLKALLHTPEDHTADTLLIYLHGNPGRPLQPESWVTDALLDKGVAVFRFNYRGLWGNAGMFNLDSSIADLNSALDFLTGANALTRYGVNPSRIVLFGYSFGTAVAISGAYDDKRVTGIAALAPCDHGYFGAEFADPDSPLKEFLDAVTRQLFSEDGPVKQNAAIFTEDLVNNSNHYRFPARALALRNKKLLFFVGIDDEVCFAEDHFFPLYRALESVSHPATDVAVLGMDHAMNPVGAPTIAAKLSDWVDSIAQQEISAMTMSNEKLQAFAVSYAAAWNSGNPGKMAEHYAEEGSLAINGGPPAVGREALAAVAESFMTGFPDMALTFDGLTFKDGRVNFHWTFKGTNTGPDGSGNRVDFSGYESWEFNDDGLIDNSQGNFDNEEYQHQLEFGLKPPGKP